MAESAPAQVMDASLPADHVRRSIFQLVDSRQATGEHGLLGLGELQPLHELADSDAVLRRQAGWLVLEVVHDQFQRAAGFVLGGRSRGADGGDGG